MAPKSNIGTAVGLIFFISTMASIPYFSRTTSQNLSEKNEKLTGSQRQRGMNLMAGQHDAGPDPNYDAKTGTYTYRKPGSSSSSSKS